jgi:hypothetical protein
MEQKMIKIFGVTITPMGFGPYGAGWIGLKIDWGNNVSGRGDYGRWAYVMISLGKRWASDGYQKAWVSHAYGLQFRWGKPPEIEEYEEFEDE